MPAPGQGRVPRERRMEEVCPLSVWHPWCQDRMEGREPGQWGAATSMGELLGSGPRGWRVGGGVCAPEPGKSQRGARLEGGVEPGNYLGVGVSPPCCPAPLTAFFSHFPSLPPSLAPPTPARLPSWTPCPPSTPYPWLALLPPSVPPRWAPFLLPPPGSQPSPPPPSQPSSL